MNYSQSTTWRFFLPIWLSPFWEITEKFYRTRGVQRLLSVLFFLVFMTLPFQIAYADPPPWLTETYSSTHFKIYYATQCPANEPRCTVDELVVNTDSDNDGTPDQVEKVAEILEQLRSEYMNTFLFEEPKFSTDPADVYLTGNCGGNYDGYRIRVCARGSINVVKRKLTHELFHAVQANYLPQPGWSSEGQANLSVDQVDNDVDDAPWGDYFKSSNEYLSAPDRYAITSTLQRGGYQASFFWKYFAERFGTYPDPGQGMDAIRTFLETGDDEDVIGIEAINRTLDKLAPGTTFQDFFKDLVITNYARKLTGAAVPAIYRIADEAELRADGQPNELDPVHLDIDEVLDATSQVGPLVSSVRAWGARYYRVTPTPDVPLISFNLEQDTTSQIFFALLGIKNGNIDLFERVVGCDFSYQLTNDHDDPYDEVVLIVGGLNHFANYRFNINASQHVVNIVEPLAVRPAEAGNPLAPSKIIVKVEILDEHSLPIRGANPEDFTITVNTQTVPAEDIVTSAWVQGQYWMVVQAPGQTAQGDYDLTVEWAGKTDTEAQAIHYANIDFKDSMLVIDRSGSMNGFDKMQSAINAANLYVDSMYNGDQVGVVSFSNQGNVDFPLQSLNDDSRVAVRNVVDGLIPYEFTCIGDGLIKALGEFDNSGNLDRDWSIVLLSDGAETEDLEPDITNFWTDYHDRQEHDPQVPKLHIIAVGPDADRGRLQDLAIRTGGTYHFAAEPPQESSSSTRVMTAAANAEETELALELSEIYRVVEETVASEQQVFSQRVHLTGIDALQIPVDANADEAVFTLSWPKSLYSPALVSLRRPNGQTLEPTETWWGGHHVWRIPHPEGGTWRLTLIPPLENYIEDYLIEVSLKSGLTLDPYISPGPAERIQGLPIFVLASLSDLAPIPGATVYGSVISPSNIMREMVLFDDGNHGDGVAGDGVYGARYYQTFEAGSHRLVVMADGVSNLGEPFVRRARRAFDIAVAEDSDGDGLPDEYEEQNGSNPLVPDGGADTDNDGLTNTEEYYAGTNPRAADTDYGGEADGSEIVRGGNPLLASDDGISSHGELYVTPGNGLNVIKFEKRPEFVTVVVFRSLSENGPYIVVARAAATGRYEDSGLTNGQTYWYKVVLQDGQGRGTPPTDPVPGTPKEDPVPPGGWISINGDAPVTYSQEVMLNLSSSDDGEFDYPTEWVGDKTDIPAAEMRISNDPNLDGANWVPFAPEKPWTLAVGEGPAVVYAQFRDTELNVSDIVSDDILVVPVRPVAIDIKPGSCPNPLNVKSPGVFPVAIVGTDEFDVTTIDPATVRLEGVAPLRSALEDVATPFELLLGKEDCLEDCNELKGDGIMDLTLKFKTQEIVFALGDVEDGECLVLELTGNLKDEFGGTPILGVDVVLILEK